MKNQELNELQEWDSFVNEREKVSLTKLDLKKIYYKRELKCTVSEMSYIMNISEKRYKYIEDGITNPTMYEVKLINEILNLSIEG